MSVLRRLAVLRYEAADVADAVEVLDMKEADEVVLEREEWEVERGRVGGGVGAPDAAAAEAAAAGSVRGTPGSMETGGAASRCRVGEGKSAREDDGKRSS